MKKLSEDIFFGIYSHLLKAEGGGKSEVSWYFAYSTVFALVFLQILIIASGMLLLGLNVSLVNDRVINGVIISSLMFLLNWLPFLKDDKYKKFLPLYFQKNELARLAKKRTVIITSLIVVQFFLALVIKIIQVS
ncbi:MAG: hypothetical protein HRU04_08735 [Oceanospirillaceae bacterium]|nr:hypothetical protein [Oceanospirillaceae bacterium]